MHFQLTHAFYQSLPIRDESAPCQINVRSKPEPFRGIDQAENATSAAPMHLLSLYRLFMSQLALQWLACCLVYPP